MAGPRNSELGVRSPLRLRGGIDFRNWEGVNRQNDPGAIRDTQLQTAINVRVNGNEIVSRGGQEKAYTTGVAGCIYGMIDVAGDLGIIVWDQYGNSDTSAVPSPGLFKYGLTSQTYGIQIASTSQLDMSSNPRRNVIPFQGRMLTFAQDPVTTVTGLWSLSQDDDGNTKWTIEVEIPDFNSFATRAELTTNGANQALYIGTKSSNTVYRWDGLTLTTEASSIGSGPLVMFEYAGEIYAASNMSLLARGSAATYTTSYAMPVGVTAFVPFTGVEYIDSALICGTDTTVGNRQKILEFDGTTVTVNRSPVAAQATFCDLAVGNGYAWSAWTSDSTATTLSQYDGATWTDVYNTVVDSQPITGALFPLGSDLYWWTSNDCAANPIGSVSTQTGVVLIRFGGFDVSAPEIATLGDDFSGLGAPCPQDMNILA